MHHHEHRLASPIRLLLGPLLREEVVDGLKAVAAYRREVAQIKRTWPEGDPMRDAHLAGLKLEHRVDEKDWVIIEVKELVSR
jgi:hypothetical protein